MSKQSKAKASQNYQGKPMAKRCRVCKHLDVTTRDRGAGWIDETLRCGIGGFKVTPNAICDLFEMGGD